MSDERMVREVLHRVEADLGAPHDLGVLAERVRCSPFHLHRRFHAVAGITAAQYVTRRRLTQAAHRLTHGTEPVIDIALTSGYGGQQSFTTAFTARYHQPPAAFRRAGRFYPLQLPHPLLDAARPGASAGPGRGDDPWRCTPAGPADLAEWMALVRAGVDMLPVLDEREHRRVAATAMTAGRAYLLHHGEAVAGGLLLSPDHDRLDLLVTHPLARRHGALTHLLRAARRLADRPGPLRTTCYRPGDRADIGHRRALLTAGAIPGDPVVELGYPTQELVLTGDPSSP